MTEEKVHKGAPRRYFCPHFFDDKGRVRGMTSRPNTAPVLNSTGALVTRTGPHSQKDTPTEEVGCYEIVLRDGDLIEDCPGHGLPTRKTRYKRVEEREWERYYKQQMSIGNMSIWTDRGARKAKCHLCQKIIEPGDQRIAFEATSPFRAATTMSGGVIKSVRNYVHRSCFVDIVMGGSPGDGCPGCTTKMINDEFRAVKKQILGKTNA